MIHFTCDRCKQDMDGDDLRYVVRLEVQAEMDCMNADDEQPDHLLEVHEILERMDDADDDAIGEDVYQRRRFDLCPECYRRYVKNPLGIETPMQLGFSSN